MSWYVERRDVLDSAPKIQGNIHILEFTCPRCDHKQVARVKITSGVFEFIYCANTDICGDRQAYLMYDPDDIISVEMIHHGKDDVPLKNPIPGYVDLLVAKAAEYENSLRLAAAAKLMQTAAEVEKMDYPAAKQLMQAMGLVAAPLG